MGSGAQSGAVGSVADVLGAVRALAEGIDRYRHAVGGQLNLGMPEIITLAQLLYAEPLRTSAVGERTGLTPGSVTALLDRLETRGYISRVRPPDNRRVVLIALTEAGRDLARGIYTPLEPLLQKVASEPDAPDPARLVHCLGRIAEVLNDLAAATATRHSG